MIRSRTEAILATIFASLAIVTMVWPAWLEVVFSIDPDAGNGSLEWILTVSFGLLAVATALFARRDFRRARIARA